MVCSRSRIGCDHSDSRCGLACSGAISSPTCSIANQVREIALLLDLPLHFLGQYRGGKRVTR